MLGLKSQKGISTLAILVVVVIVLIAGVGIFLLTRSDNTPSTKTSTQNETPTPHSEDTMMQNSQFKMDGQATSGAQQENGNLTPDVTIELTAKNFSFNQKEIRVKEGQVVKIVLTSEEGFHDWAIDEFSAVTEQVNTGQTAEVTFTANKKGTFEYYCSVGSHRQFGMIGNLIVE